MVSPRLLLPPSCLPPSPGELELSKVPFWEFTGDYLKRPREEVAPAAEINGVGFCPWQYPNMHERL